MLPTANDTRIESGVRQVGLMTHLGLSQSTQSPRTPIQRTIGRLTLPCQVDPHLRRGTQRMIEASGQIMASQGVSHQQ